MRDDVYFLPATSHVDLATADPGRAACSWSD